MSDFQERRWSSSDGLGLYARDYPAAPGPTRLPVICLHGLTRNSKDFEEVAPRLAAGGRRVLVPDVRGRGRSDRDPSPGNYVPTRYARDVIDLLDRLGIARAVFLGTSMGGIITMVLAARRSRAIAAAILNDVGPVVDPAGVTRIMSYVGKRPELSSWSAATGYVRGINEAAFPDYGEEDWERFARRTFRDNGGTPELDYDPAIMVPLQEGRYKAPRLLAWYLFLRLARSRPTLLIRGALSDVISARVARQMSARAPRLQRAEVANVGHAPSLLEPEASHALEGFLDRVD